ncbi:MAG: hypothetical protein M1833_000679 [Piccolia ochrophora]|nr:MAG: hypothetical protein M1833_000679 [Piccolia ochrophora]
MIRGIGLRLALRPLRRGVLRSTRGGKPALRPFDPRPSAQQRYVSSTATAIQEPDSSPPPFALPAAATFSSPLTLDPKPGRRESVRHAKPFSEFLTDDFNRHHDYLRISITEKCNLRCLYCMPEEGVPLSPPAHLLSSPEITYLSSLFVSQGVTKIRLTGGEPTIRRDIVLLMHSIGSLRPHGLKELCLTTNGITLHRKLDSMAEAGLTGVNLSLDTLDPFQFQIMTRRKGFEAVMKSIDRILEMNRLGAGIKLKINCVVMRGVNDREILAFVEFGRERDVEVRFIEYMPFGGNKWNQGKMFSYQEMLDLIRTKYPSLQKVRDHKNDTSKTYHVPGFVGRIGFITSMTHNFCGSCNRLRITSDGNLKVCLFGNSEVSLRDLLRKDNDGAPLNEAAFEATKQIEMDRRQQLSSSSRDSAVSDREQGLLEVIGAAVKRKKAKHAGMGELEKMPNRPMILIDEPIFSQKWFNEPPVYANSRSSRGLLRRGVRVVPAWSTSRLFSTSTLSRSSESSSKPPPRTSLPHLTASGTAHMVRITSKVSTSRRAVAIGHITFSNPETHSIVQSSSLQKGDALAVARIAGIGAAKRASDLIPLCHPITLSYVGVDVELHGSESGGTEGGLGRFGGVRVTATVECEGRTGVEMEALTAVCGAALAVVDMVKGVDKGCTVGGVKVMLKSGGRSGEWRAEGFHEGKG